MFVPSAPCTFEVTTVLCTGCVAVSPVAILDATGTVLVAGSVF